MFWQIGDFLLMVVIVGLFVRFVVRSGRRSPDAEPPVRPDADELADGDGDGPAAHR